MVYLFMLFFQRVHLDSLETTAIFRVAIPVLETTVRAYATVTFWLATLSSIALVNFNTLFLSFVWWIFKYVIFYLFLTIRQHTFHFMLKHYLIKIFLVLVVLFNLTSMFIFSSTIFFIRKVFFRSNYVGSQTFFPAPRMSPVVESLHLFDTKITTQKH